ncbi:HNH endonuclease [Arenibaculum sp.]|uniref:HNH endonuclease n=1 Tax=Arenibaculum sp. TaxID=2865862 RepID=UPI002E13DEF8|nr:HNH endonuclease [Arenibaculum sp.]
MSRARRDDGAVNILGYEETEADRRGERDLLRAANRHAAVAHGGMVKAVFDTKPGSGYDDSTERYHFPRSYLGHARACVGDWVILREPRRNGGRRAYVAAARVERIDPDPDRAGHSYAILRDYLPFDVPVPFRSPDGHREAILRAVPDPTQVGRALRGASVRPIPDDDFAAIVNEGLRETLSPANAVRLELDAMHVDPATAALITAAPAERRVEQVLMNRKVRDAAFRRAVLAAYDDTCAVTGIKIVNGGGRAEAQAAHIWPVADGGPDVVQNGIALSATVHWLFDRHLISIDDDWRLLVSHNKVPPELRELFTRHQDRIRLPKDRSLWPHPAFVARHREHYG